MLKKLIKNTFALVLISSSLLANADEKHWTPNKNQYEGETCVDPMIQARGEYTIGKEGLEGIADFFKSLDKNKDNKLCLDEIDDKGMLDAFEEYDMNKDGCITPREVSLTLERMIIASWLKEFYYMDGNKDGFVEMYELENRFSNTDGRFMQPEQIMSEYDLDFDDKISKEEYTQRSWELYKGIKQENPSLANIKTKTTKKSVTKPLLNLPKNKTITAPSPARNKTENPSDTNALSSKLKVD